MRALTRRELVGTCSMLLAGLGGCTDGTLSGQDTTSSPTPTVTEQGFARSLRTPDAQTVRRPGSDPAVRGPTRSPPEGSIQAEWLIQSREGLENLEFPRGARNVEAARELIRSTDFATNTVLAHQYRTTDCETYRLQRVQWGRSMDTRRTPIEVTYESRRREKPCTGDASTAVEATFVRVPDTIDRIGYFGVRVR